MSSKSSLQLDASAGIQVDVLPTPTDTVLAVPSPAAASGMSSRRYCLDLDVSPISSLKRLVFTRRRPIRNYVWCTIFTALGGFIWGFDTGSIGPITLMPQFEAQFGELTPTVQGLIVSSILITAAISSAVSGPVADRISRTYTIALGGLVSAIGSAIVCSAMTLAQLFAGRCIAGVGQGLFISMITVYVTEIAPASSRGRLATMVQLFNSLGLASGYFVCYGTIKVPSSFSWRFPFGAVAVIGIIFSIGSIFLPHSPRWLTLVGRHDQVHAAIVKLGMRQDEISGPPPNVVHDKEKTSFWIELKQLWAKDVRFRTTFGVFMMVMQQLSGIDAVLYYAPVLFAQAGLSSTTASFLASGVSGLVIVVCTLIAQGFQDRWSRRSQAIGGGTGIAVTMLLIGILYASQASDTHAGQWTVVVLLYLFIVSFVSSWAVVFRIICSELQPIKTRAAATSLAQCLNWIVNWIIAFSTPLFLARSSSGPYFLFGGCSLFTVMMCVAFQPETNGINLDVLDKGLEEAPWKKALKKRRGLRNRLAGTEFTTAESTGIELDEIRS